MFVRSGRFTYKYKKSQKPDIKYLKNIKTKLDKYNREREVGEIDLLKIPSKDLIAVMQDVWSVELKSEKKSNGYTYFSQEIDEFKKTLKDEYNMYYGTDLRNLIKEYLQIVDGTKKYETLAKILNITCKLEYLDYDNHEYDEDPEYVKEPTPTQKEVNHNFVGDFTLTIIKPIPMKVIGAMLKETLQHKKGIINKKAERHDKENSTQELNDLAEQLF